MQKDDSWLFRPYHGAYKASYRMLNCTLEVTSLAL